MLCCLIAKTRGEGRTGDFGIGDESDCLKIRKMIGLIPENVGLYGSLSVYRNRRRS
jgi:ABC-2 type transport system ATP-binding protein